MHFVVDHLDTLVNRRNVSGERRVLTVPRVRFSSGPRYARAMVPDVRLTAAKARLDSLAYYPRPVRIDGVRLVVSALPFRLPWLRRFDGWATHRVIFLRRPGLLDDADLITHELCHVWQMQHRPVRMPWSYLFSYTGNPYEQQARRAAGITRPAGGSTT
jgi:hypothetical protein